MARQKDGTGSSGGKARPWGPLRRLMGSRPGRAARQQAVAPAAALPGRGRAVLLVDMDRATAVPLAQHLRLSGFAAQVVDDQAAALAYLGRAQPALVIVVGPAGLDLYAALRRATPALILALDARAREAHVLAAFDAGVDQFRVERVSSAEAVVWILALLRRAA